MSIVLFVNLLLLAQAAPAHVDEGGTAGAAAPPATEAEHTNDCPSRDAVATALSPALVRRPAGADPLPADFHVADLGAAFEVTAAGQTQRYVDPAHDCAERARMAAVFVALAMNPPISPPPPPPPRVVAPPPPPPPPPPVERTQVDVGLAARFDGSAGGGKDATGGAAAGGEIQVAVGRRHLSLEATAGALTSTENTFGSVSVREQRFPCSLSGVLRLRLPAHLELGAALGVALTPFTLHGDGLASTLPVRRLDVGGRVAVELKLRDHVLTPFASVHLEYFPRSYDIVVAPLGEIGTTAPLQIGISLGLALEARR